MLNTLSALKSWVSRDTLTDKTQDFPSEILTEIFTLVCGGEVRIPPVDHKYPWSLGYVCSRWRQILWSSPSIWNKITTIPALHYSPFEGIIRKNSTADVLRYILSNISTPVSLTVSRGKYLPDVSTIILENFDRFVELSMDGIPQDMLISLLHLPQNKFTVLEKISLSWIDLYQPVLKDIRSPLEMAPNLRSVEYMMESPTYAPPLFLLPWDRLEEVFVNTMRIPPDVLFDIFRRSLALVSCSFFIDTTWGIPISDEIVLPALKMLRLETRQIFSWHEFLSPLITPSLEFLDLISPQIPCASVTSLIVRSRCSLKRLYMFEPNGAGEYIGTEDLTLLLDHLPLLTDITIPWSIPPPFFTQLHDGALPKLVNAHLEVHPEGLEAFLDMLDAHIDSPQRYFSDFEIVCHRGPGFSAVRDRYLACYNVYNTIEGWDITVINKELYAAILIDPETGEVRAGSG